jgi:nitroreductase
MNEVIKNMLERRSIRKYKPEQIAEETLNIILLAGTYAPSAGGRQSPVIVACRDAEINDRLGKINKAAFKGRISTEKSCISKEQPSIADDVSLKSGFYGAPTVLTLFAPRNFLYSVADCCIAAQNIVLAAHSLGVGSCIVARAEDTFANASEQYLQQQWGIGSDYEAKMHVTLGYPADDAPPKAKPRKEGRIIRVF